MKLSTNFSLAEYTKSQTASRKGIDNYPNTEHLECAKALFENVVQKVRDHFGPTIITSGYRSPALNEAIGGSTVSQHSKGQAVDIECLGVPTAEVAEWIAANLDFDQVILEFYNPEIPDSGWTHVSYDLSKKKQRKSVLTAVKENGETVYKQGLIY